VVTVAKHGMQLKLAHSGQPGSLRKGVNDNQRNSRFCCFAALMLFVRPVQADVRSESNTFVATSYSPLSGSVHLTVDRYQPTRAKVKWKIEGMMHSMFLSQFRCIPVIISATASYKKPGLSSTGKDCSMIVGSTESRASVRMARSLSSSRCTLKKARHIPSRHSAWGARSRS
jgi:hypothetical protein